MTTRKAKPIPVPPVVEAKAETHPAIVSTTKRRARKLRRVQDAEFTNKLANRIVSGFFLVCLLVIGLVAFGVHVSEWAAGTIGALIGYWANAAQQAQSLYFGASPSAQQQSGDATTNVKVSGVTK